MSEFPYSDIIILALIAVFVLLRLRNILGQKSDGEPPPFFNLEKREQKNKNERESAVESVVHVAGKNQKTKSDAAPDAYMESLNNQAVAESIAAIKKLDANFNATSFLNGAKMAYEMVFDAFAKGDKNTLEMLLDKPVFETFVQEIEGRAAKSEKTELTLVSVRPKDIIRASLTGNKAQIAVKFDSEQVSLTKDADGRIVSGDPSQTIIMDDEWLFERDVTSKNPNWKIIET